MENRMKHMKFINLMIDPLVMGALDRVATSVSLTRGDLIRAILYDAIKCKRTVTRAPTWPKAFSAEPALRLLNGRMIRVDSNGIETLSTDVD